MLLLLFVTNVLLVSFSIQNTPSYYSITEKEKNYLIAYNYMPETNNGAGPSNNSPREIFLGLKKLQEFFKIQVTGYMNRETRDLMEIQRCGNNDVDSNVASDSELIAKHLTWKVEQYSTQIDNNIVDDTIKSAFNKWAQDTELTFEHKPSSEKVDITFGFYKDVHGDSAAFDGTGGVFGHAFSLNYGDKNLAWKIHLDDSEKWAIEKKFYENQKVHLGYVVLHQIGHALGMVHSTDNTSIMFPQVDFWKSNPKLSQNDVIEINKLYEKLVTPTKGPSSTTTEPVTTTRYIETTTRKNVDIFCYGYGIDAAIEYGSNSYLLFKDNKVRKITIMGETTTLNIRDLFRGSLMEYRKINAVINTHEKYNWEYIKKQWRNVRSGSNATYVFQAGKIHTFVEENGIYYESGLNPVSSSSGFPINIDAAFTWSGDGQIYLIKGNQYYRMITSDTGFVIDNGYPKYLSEWRGLPYRINAALHMSRFDLTMFFSGDYYYKYEDPTMSVSRNYPRSVRHDWLGCQ